MWSALGRAAKVSQAAYRKLLNRGGWTRQDHKRQAGLIPCSREWPFSRWEKCSLKMVFTLLMVLWSFVRPWVSFTPRTERHRECTWRKSQPAVVTWNNPFSSILFELHTHLYTGFISGWIPWTTGGTSFSFHSSFYVCSSVLNMTISISELK